MEEKNTSPADFQEPKRESLLTREQYLALSAILEATGTEEAACFTDTAAKELEYNTRRDFLENIDLYFSGLFDYEDKQQRAAASRGLKDLVRMLYAADDMAVTIQAAGRLFTEYAKARTDESRRTEALEKWEQTRHKRGEKDAPK